jgi:Zn-finger protein
MSYSSWFQAHGEKHKKIIDKLSHFSDNELIKYFRFDNMVKHEPDFCPLYAKNKKCHDNEELNCYFCACPNFRFKDEGFETIEERTLFSTCNIDSQDGSQYISDTAIHQNCAGCFIPHSESYIKKYFTRDWFKAMSEVRKNG